MFPSHRRSRWSSRRHFEPVRLSHTHSSSAAHCAGAASPPLLQLASSAPTPLQASLGSLPLSGVHVNAHASLPSNADTLPARARADASASNRPRPETPTRLPAPPRVSLPALPPAHRPRSPSAFFQGSGSARCSRLRAGHGSASARALPPTRPRSNTHFASVTPPLTGQLRWGPSPTSPGRVVTPDPPQSTTPPKQWGEAPRSPSTALCPSQPVTVTQPEGRAAWARAAVARLKAGVSRGQASGPGRPDYPGGGGAGKGHLPAGCPPLARPPLGRGRPARHPRAGPWRPRHGARPPSARGAAWCSSPAPPHPLLAAPKGQETGVACLSWARLPWGELRALDKGVHRYQAREWSPRRPGGVGGRRAHRGPEAPGEVALEAPAPRPRSGFRSARAPGGPGGT